VGVAASIAAVAVARPHAREVGLQALGTRLNVRAVLLAVAVDEAAGSGVVGTAGSRVPGVVVADTDHARLCRQRPFAEAVLLASDQIGPCARLTCADTRCRVPVADAVLHAGGLLGGEAAARTASRRTILPLAVRVGIAASGHAVLVLANSLARVLFTYNTHGAGAAADILQLLALACAERELRDICTLRRTVALGRVCDETAIATAEIIVRVPHAVDVLLTGDIVIAMQRTAGRGAATTSGLHASRVRGTHVHGRDGRAGRCTLTQRTVPLTGRVHRALPRVVVLGSAAHGAGGRRGGQALANRGALGEGDGLAVHGAASGGGLARGAAGR